MMKLPITGSAVRLLFYCPVLAFFSILRLGRTGGLIFTLYGSSDVFPRKDGPFVVRTMDDHIWGNVTSEASKMGRE